MENLISTQDVGVSNAMTKRVTELFKEIGEGSVSTDDLILAIEMDISVMPLTLNVSYSEKRQKTQYNPNDYFASMQLDVSDLGKIVLGAVKAAPEGEKLNAYIKNKRILYQMIEDKISMNREFLKECVHAQQQEDGISII
jgi:hypothetical protein